MKAILLVLLLAVFLPRPASAQGFKGSVNFTGDEMAAHQKHIRTITKTARRHLETIWNEHLRFYRQHRVSKFYGDRNVSLNTRSKRIAALRQAGAPASLVDQLQATSCVGLTLDALHAGFRAPGDPKLVAAWGKIHQFARANDLDGCAVLHALQKLGWKIAYWNPSPGTTRGGTGKTEPGRAAAGMPIATAR
jgi:hypothetical protein